MDLKQTIFHFLANNFGLVIIGCLAIFFLFKYPKSSGLVIGIVLLWLVTRFLGPGTVIERGVEQSKLNTNYQQCLESAASQLVPLVPQIQPKVRACATMTGRAKEQCLEKVLSTDGADQGGMDLMQSCVNKWQVIGNLRSSIKPLAQPLCVPFLPEFLNKIFCKPN
jgi:hypothetical protein